MFRLVVNQFLELSSAIRFQSQQAVSAQVSRLYLVDMPGSERLLVEAELLRVREGAQVNQSLLAWATTLRRLANGAPPAMANHHNSVLTKLLSGDKLVDMTWEHCYTLLSASSCGLSAILLTSHICKDGRLVYVTHTS